jgi:hypothetical protein
VTTAGTESRPGQSMRAGIAVDMGRQAVLLRRGAPASAFDRAPVYSGLMPVVLKTFVQVAISL